MSQIANGALHTFVDGEIATASVLNQDNTVIQTAVNDNYARITALDAVVKQAGFTPTSAYDYFQTNFSNSMALYWMGGF